MMFISFKPRTSLKSRNAVGSSKRTIYSVHETSVPGMLMYKNFISPQHHEYILKKALRDQRLMKKYIAERQPPMSTMKVHQFNLESYSPVKLVDDEGHGRSAQTYPVYIEPGRTLALFVGYDNVPIYVWNLLRDMKSDIEEMKTMKVLDELMWRLTMNFYDMTKEDIVPPFHREVEENGIITTILALENPSTVEMIKGGYTKDGFPKDSKYKIEKIELDPMSMLVMTGEARWEWLYRVLPAQQVERPTSRVTFNMAVKDCPDGKRGFR